MFFLKRKEKKRRKKARKNLLVCFFSLEQQSRKRKAGMRVADSFFFRSKENPLKMGKKISNHFMFYMQNPHTHSVLSYCSSQRMQLMLQFHVTPPTSTRAGSNTNLDPLFAPGITSWAQRSNANTSSCKILNSETLNQKKKTTNTFPLISILPCSILAWYKQVSEVKVSSHSLPSGP